MKEEFDAIDGLPKQVLSVVITWEANMAKKMHLSVLFLGISTVAAVAALPPTAESLRILAAVAGSAHVAQAFGSADHVKSITESSPDVFVVESEKCRVQAEVSFVPLPRPMVGPSKIKVKVTESDCHEQ